MSIPSHESPHSPSAGVGGEGGNRAGTTPPARYLPICERTSFCSEFASQSHLGRNRQTTISSSAGSERYIIGVTDHGRDELTGARRLHRHASGVISLNTTTCVRVSISFHPDYSVHPVVRRVRFARAYIDK